MAGRGKRRSLTEEERMLWEKATATAERLHLEKPEFVQVIDVPKARIPDPIGRFSGFGIGEKATSGPEKLDLKPSLEETLAATSPNMDKRNFDRLKKGKKAVDATIDLHGMTLAAAHPRLISFVLNSHANGLRLLLVITGKGRDARSEPYAERPRGVLRQQVPDWLSRPPLAHLVLQITQAHGKHGGSGAYYVYLRRVR